MYFMSTVCGRPQGGRGSGLYGRTWTEGGIKNLIFVDVINGWPEPSRISLLLGCIFVSSVTLTFKTLRNLKSLKTYTLFLKNQLFTSYQKLPEM